MTTIPESLRGQAPAIAAVVPPLAAATNDTGRTVWCGPVALSAITGAPASEIEALIRAGRSARPVPALGQGRSAARGGEGRRPRRGGRHERGRPADGAGADGLGHPVKKVGGFSKRMGLQLRPEHQPQAAMGAGED